MGTCFGDWKPGEFDGVTYSLGVEKVALSYSIPNEELRTLDMIRHQRGVRCAARKLYLASVRVDDVTVFAISPDDASHEADVVKEAGYNKVGVIVGRRRFE